MTGPAADRTAGLWPAGSNIKKIQGISIDFHENPIDLEAAGGFSTILEANP